MKEQQNWYFGFCRLSSFSNMDDGRFNQDVLNSYFNPNL